MRKFSIKQALTKIFLVLICLLSITTTIVNPVAIKSSPTNFCAKKQIYQIPSLREIVKSLFKKEQKQTDRSEKVYVYLGGYPLGFTIKCSGVVIVAVSNESAYELKAGDILTHIEGIKIYGLEDITKLINNDVYAGRPLNVTYLRNAEQKQTKIKPIYDERLNVYKLGLWIRDNSAGVGTLTYVRKDNLRYGALGHPVCDIDTGTALPVNNGNIYKCNIVGYKAGVKGNPGELKGLFLRSGSMLGTLDKNNKFGVYGKFSRRHIGLIDDKVIEVANRSEIKSGKAQIRCTIDGSEPKYYDIEIVKTYFQSTKDNKSMFIRVTDKELLSQTGGIVQGMSGSPIIQNGKLVGAVTHVFVSDPTKGYGLYADWMIEN